MSRAARGYLLVAGSFLIMGFIGVLVEWATAPESALLVILGEHEEEGAASLEPAP